MATAEGQIQILKGIRNTPLEIDAILMEKQFSLGDLAALTPGSILHFDLPPNQPARLHINNNAIAEGEVVQIRDNFGIKITSVKE